MKDYQTILRHLNKTPRPEQQALCNDIVDVGRFGECLLAQADTGIGKTLATTIAVKTVAFYLRPLTFEPISIESDMPDR